MLGLRLNHVLEAARYEFILARSRFGKGVGCDDTKAPDKYQNDAIMLTLKLAASRRREILHHSTFISFYDPERFTNTTCKEWI